MNAPDFTELYNAAGLDPESRAEIVAQCEELRRRGDTRDSNALLASVVEEFIAQHRE